MRKLIPFACVLTFLAVAPSVWAQSVDDEEPVYSGGTVTIAGEEVRYQAEAGRMTLRDDDGKPEVRIFYVAYRRSNARVQRPITFVFNGGPGSSAVWLHMGLVGPQRVVMPDDASFPRTPYELTANEQSILDVTDLVCIDPPTTGYSRAAKGVDATQYHGLEGDLAVVGRFIHQWITRHGRWASPKFLMGESYGTTRAAGLSEHLQSRYGIELAGVALISSVLDFNTRHNGNDMVHVLMLPSYTATAWYHKRLAPELQAKPLRTVLDEAEAFALGEYATGLLQGTRRSASDRRALAGKLARFIGCDPGFCERSNLRIGLGRFCKELRRDDRATVGRLDSRYIGRDRDAAGESYSYDSSYAAILGPYTEGLMRHLRTIGYQSPLKYEILTGKVNPWDWGKRSHRHITDVSSRLRTAMTRNPHLQVYVANGYYDLATPYFATEHTIHHMRLEGGLEKNITMAYYESGHMMYIHEPSLRQQREDLVRWYAKALLSDMQRTGTDD